MTKGITWILFWGGSRTTKPCVFPCEVAAGGDETYFLCAVVAAGVVPDVMGSSSVFCNKWLYLRTYFYQFLEFVIAYRIGMAA